MAETPIQLKSFETNSVYLLDYRGAGTYRKDFRTEGNSLLSSVYVRSIDAGATLTVKYYQTTGSEELFGEKQFLGTHVDFTGASTVPETNTILVARIHNKPFIEAIVTGGNCEFAIYATLLTQNASDIDAALQLDGATTDLVNDKGVPMMCYDEAQNKFFFLRCEGGTIPVSIGEEGDAFLGSNQTTSTPGTAQDLINVTVPASKSRKLTKAIVVCRHHGFYKITAGGAIIGSGRTGPASSKSEFQWVPRSIHTTGTNLKITFTALLGTPSIDVEAYLMGSDIDT